MARGKRIRIEPVKLDMPKDCSACHKITEFGTKRGRALHPSCSYGFELFHPETEYADEGIEACLDLLGARVVAVRSWEPT